ncbi:hypothetical protein Tco_0421853, partial [Tanacetum coccineum]
VQRSLHIPLGVTLLLHNVTIHPSTGNFNIPCVVDGMARIFLIPGLPIIPLCWDGDLITMKFIHAEMECSSSPIIGPSVPFSSPKDGKEITVSREKLWVTLCLATLYHG